MAGGLNLYSGLGAEAKFRAHLGHEQLTALVETLRGVRYKAVLKPCLGQDNSLHFDIFIENSASSRLSMPKLRSHGSHCKSFSPIRMPGHEPIHANRFFICYRAPATARLLPRACYRAPATARLLPRACIYGERFRNRVKSLSIEEVLTALRSPWQSPYVERLIGSLRRECLNHIIIFNERHLRRQLKSYTTYYYHEARTHLSLDKQCPVPRLIQDPDQESIVAIPHLGGLHHEFRRAA